MTENRPGESSTATTATVKHRRDKGFQARYGPWALITGASSGIGKALAAEVAARGINVVLVARNRQALQGIADDLRGAHHVETIVIAADLADPNAVDGVDDQTRDLDIGLVIFAAGFGTAGAFAEAPPIPELEMIAVNISAVTRLTHTFARRLVIRGRGGIILFGSSSDGRASPGWPTIPLPRRTCRAWPKGCTTSWRPRASTCCRLHPGRSTAGLAPGPV